MGTPFVDLDYRFGGASRSVDFSNSSTTNMSRVFPQVNLQSFTAMAWFYWLGVSFQGVGCIDVAPGAFFAGIAVNLGASTLAVSNNNANANVGTLTANHWVCIALTNSTTHTVGYMTTKTTKLTSATIAASPSFSGACTCNLAGATANFFNGYVSSFKLWNYPMKATDVFRETRQRAPINRGSQLVSYLPLASAGSALIDEVYAGVWSSVGTLKTALQVPPVPELLAPKKHFFL